MADRRDEWWAKSARDLSVFLGLAYKHLLDCQWYRDLPRDPKGFYIPEAVAAYLNQSLRNPAIQQQSGDGGRIAKLREAKLAEEARQKKRENDEAESLLLPRDGVERYLTQWAVRFRTPLLRLPDKISNRVPGSMKAAVKGEVEADVIASLKMVRDMKLSESTVEELVLAEANRILADREPDKPVAKKKKAKRKATRKTAKR